jgi:DNA-binding IclR family transcriptional regulator
MTPKRGRTGSQPITSHYNVQVLDRAIAVLQTVADSNTYVAAADIAKRLGLHKSTAHRLLVVLEDHGLVKKGPEGTYRLGTRLIELGDSAVARLNLGERAAPFLRDLAKKTGEGVHVTILSDTEMLSIAHVEGRWKLQSLRRAGQRIPIHCTAAGKAALAFLPAQARDELLARLRFERRTANTIVRLSALKAELAGVRHAGFAVDDEEFEEGLRCVGAPIFDHRGRVVASISMAAPVFRLRKDRLADVGRIVIAAARGFSAELGNPGTDLERDQRKRGQPTPIKSRRA